jgi:hypothetical protein
MNTSEENYYYSSLKTFAICFNPSFSEHKIVDVDVPKKYLSLGKL